MFNLFLEMWYMCSDRTVSVFYHVKSIFRLRIIITFVIKIFVPCDFREGHDLLQHRDLRFYNYDIIYLLTLKNVWMLNNWPKKFTFFILFIFFQNLINSRLINESIVLLIQEVDIYHYTFAVLFWWKISICGSTLSYSFMSSHVIFERSCMTFEQYWTHVPCY